MSGPIVITGWSLQSAVSGVRGFIGPAADLFVMGTVQSQKAIALEAGASASIASGSSPVGVSFRENLCTGYLSQMQSFAPTLSMRCPAPAESMPLTAETIRTFGDRCLDYVHALPTCTYPTILPGDLSPACRSFIMERLSYNGCVQTHRYKSGFVRNEWRVYLGASGELWRNAHDVVRLLDAEGRTVDIIIY